MVLAAYDTSNLVALEKDGVQCETCCVIGEPCEHCDVATPKTIYVQVTGAVDLLEGACTTVFITGQGDVPAKYEGMAADDVLNNKIIELTQSILACTWTEGVALSEATLKTYGEAEDCSGAVHETRGLCLFAYAVERKAATTALRIGIYGDEDAGWACEHPAQILWAWAISVDMPCAGSACLCCELEGVGDRYYDMSNATIRIWSDLCPTMHINSVVAEANPSDCGGDEERAIVTVRAHDANDDPIENAHIEITLTGEVSDVVYVDTDGDGIAVYTSDCLCVAGTINVEVTNLTKGGYVWNSDDDEDGLTDSIVMDCV